MFLGQNGALTPYIWEACEFPDLSKAVHECERHRLAPSDFAFRIFEPEPGEELQILSAC
jgi:hypothetical protein